MFQSLPILPSVKQDTQLLEYSRTLLLKSKVTKLRLLSLMPSLKTKKDQLEVRIAITNEKIRKQTARLEKHKLMEEHIAIYDNLDREIKRLKKLKNRT